MNKGFPFKVKMLIDANGKKVPYIMVSSKYPGLEKLRIGVVVNHKTIAKMLDKIDIDTLPF